MCHVLDVTLVMLGIDFRTGELPSYSCLVASVYEFDAAGVHRHLGVRELSIFQVSVEVYEVPHLLG